MGVFDDFETSWSLTRAMFTFKTICRSIPLLTPRAEQVTSGRHGPKTTSNATSHDDCVSVRIFQIKGELKAMKRARKRLTIAGNRISDFAVAAGNLSIEKPLQGEL